MKTCIWLSFFAAAGILWAAPSITVLSPNGGETIGAGSTYEITWTSQEIPGLVAIEYHNGVGWTLLTPDGTENDGQYAWDPVPDLNSGNCQVWIHENGNPAVGDTSDGIFAIYTCQRILKTDFNSDCYVDLGDLTQLSLEWLLCGNPYDESCFLQCDPGYADCDLWSGNGCEISIFTDPDHCGDCQTVCLIAHANALCQGGICVIGTCQEGYVDLNGDPADGCECSVSGPDLPDDAFVDSNCDGVDGQIDQAVFVDTVAGNDGNNGLSPQLPKKTVAGAITTAVAFGRPYLIISKGTYSVGTLNLVSNLSLYGGYDAANGWARSGSNLTRLVGSSTCVYGLNVSEVVLSHLTIEAADAPSTYGASSYALLLRTCSDITVRHCSIYPGDGRGGLLGIAGPIGSSGQPGQPGTPGCEDGSILCSTCSQPLGGLGGSSPCGMTGGKGGDARAGEANGQDGQDGVGGAFGGNGGRYGYDNYPDSCVTNYPWTTAENGDAGSVGTNGSAGASFGTMATSGYLTSNGQDGTNGGNGGGGGGGGGGCGGTVSCDSYGSSGGGGGGGGCGGQRGIGGGGGGGSFGLYIYSCGDVFVQYCQIFTGSGGNGGGGGLGGNGGNGSPGGARGSYGGTDEQDDAGCGGVGGGGGGGGRGGHGGGGGGGPSIGILYTASSLVMQSGNTFSLGSGGAGGFSSGSSGAAGLRMTVHVP